MFQTFLKTPSIRPGPGLTKESVVSSALLKVNIMLFHFNPIIAKTKRIKSAT